jgi:uncharacterized protein YbjT (DUF2867 family)
MSDQILVTGATGKQGSAIIRHLLKYDQKIRAMTRDPFKADELEKLGVEAVIGDLLDSDSLVSALKGIKKMYLVTTPYNTGVDEEIVQGMTAVDAARAAGVEYMVYSSVGSADRNTGIPHFDSKWKIEEHIRELGFDYFILRPVYFMDNLGSPWVLPSLKKGELELPVKVNRKLAMVAVDDIGKFLAQAFIYPEKFVGRAVEFAGEELTFPQALSMISKASGASLVYKEVPEVDSERMFGHDAATMYKWFNDVGYNPDIPGTEKKFSFPLMRFADYLKNAPWLKELGNPVAAKQEKNR